MADHKCSNFLGGECIYDGDIVKYGISCLGPILLKLNQIIRDSSVFLGTFVSLVLLVFYGYVYLELVLKEFAMTLH